MLDQSAVSRVSTACSARPTTPTRSYVSQRSRPPASVNTTLDMTGDLEATEVKDKETSPDLPSVNERLAYLRPSRELLEYYRKKIAEYDGEHDDMLHRLDAYKMTYEQQHTMQWELRQREDEITELQKALSDMQVYLFQEREHVLRLYAENDRLKIRELEDRKKIHTLLQISGMTESEVSYFMKEPPNIAIVQQKLPKKLHNQLASQQNQAMSGLQKKLTGSTTNTKDKSKQLIEEEREKYRKDNQTLALQVEALQAQLEEQTKLAKEQVDAMIEDRRVKIDEQESRRTRDTDKIQTLTEKLHKTQDLLYDSTRDFLNLRFEHRAHERDWMGDKDKLLRELDSCKQQLMIDHDEVLNVEEETMETRVRREEEMRSLKYQLGQTQKLADMYREQVIQLEDSLAKIREEGDVGKELFKERSEKQTRRLELMNTRYQDLERRRNLEVEGFKTDIKNLRARLKDLEKQLYKVTLGMSEDLDGKTPEDIDMQILRNIRRTAGRSHQIVGELKHLKAKVYGLENDLRHL